DEHATVDCVLLPGQRRRCPDAGCLGNAAAGDGLTAAAAEPKDENKNEERSRCAHEYCLLRRQSWIAPGCLETSPTASAAFLLRANCLRECASDQLRADARRAGQDSCARAPDAAELLRHRLRSASRGLVDAAATPPVASLRQARFGGRD